MSIEVKNLSFCYNKGTSLEKTALEGITLSIGKGEFVLVGGEVGSGKSTLIKHFNGLLKARSGSVLVGEMDASDRKIRSKVGLLLQYPQKQLFEKTVFEDVSFAPSNFGLKGNELDERVSEALKLVGLNEDIYSKSPFSLSGGQMRLVALAGVLAMKPEYLILDEPTSGLDPENRSWLISVLGNLRAEGISIIVVSHQVCEFLPVAEKIIYLNKGRVVFNGTTADYLNSVSFPLPEITLLMRELKKAGFDVSGDIFSVDDAFAEISSKILEKGDMTSG